MLAKRQTKHRNTHCVQADKKREPNYSNLKQAKAYMLLNRDCYRIFRLLCILCFLFSGHRQFKNGHLALFKVKNTFRKRTHTQLSNPHFYKLDDAIIHHQGWGWQFCQIEPQGIGERHCGIEFPHRTLLWQQRREEKKTEERDGEGRGKHCTTPTNGGKEGLWYHRCPIKSRSLPTVPCKPGLVKDRWKTYCSPGRITILDS